MTIKMAILDNPPGNKYAVPVNYKDEVDWHGQAVAYLTKKFAPKNALIYGINIRKFGWNLPQALAWCIENKIAVVNISQSLLPTEQNIAAVDFACNHLIISCAAGNSGTGDDSTVQFPASHPRTIAWGNYNAKLGKIASDSSVGPEVDAVVQGVWDDIPMPDGTLRPVAGTSFAAPVGTGYIARYAEWFIETYRRLPTVEEVKEFIRQNSKNLDIPGKDPASGWGLFVWPKEWPLQPLQNMQQSKEVEIMKIEMWAGRNIAIVDGKEVELDQPPVQDPETNRTLVPIRFVAEALGFKVNWNEEDRKVTIVKGGMP